MQDLRDSRSAAKRTKRHFSGDILVSGLPEGNAKSGLDVPRTLKESADSFPPEFSSHKVLPSLIAALEYGGASANAILPLVTQFSKAVDDSEFVGLVLMPLVKLFATPDRGVRMALLESLPEWADKLDHKTVADKVWPHFVRHKVLRSELLLNLCRTSKPALEIPWQLFAKQRFALSYSSRPRYITT